MTELNGWWNDRSPPITSIREFEVPDDHHLAEEGAPWYRIDYVARLADWVERWANPSKESVRDQIEIQQGTVANAMPLPVVAVPV